MILRRLYKRDYQAATIYIIASAFLIDRASDKETGSTKTCLAENQNQRQDKHYTRSKMKPGFQIATGAYSYM
jgi:hypothetical protein